MASSGLVALHSIVRIMHGEPPPDPEAGWSALNTDVAPGPDRGPAVRPAAGRRAGPGADRPRPALRRASGPGDGHRRGLSGTARAMTATSARTGAATTLDGDRRRPRRGRRAVPRRSAPRSTSPSRTPAGTPSRAPPPTRHRATRSPARSPSGALAGGRSAPGVSADDRRWHARSPSRSRRRWRRSRAAIATPPPATPDRARRIDEELAHGRRLQRSFVSLVAPDVPGFDIASHYEAAREVGGDFFDLFRLRRRGQPLSVVIADVTGKGIAAALLMAFSRPLLHAAIDHTTGPAEALERTNRILVERTPLVAVHHRAVRPARRADRAPARRQCRPRAAAASSARTARPIECLARLGAADRRVPEARRARGRRRPGARAISCCSTRTASPTPARRTASGSRKGGCSRRSSRRAAGPHRTSLDAVCGRGRDGSRGRSSRPTTSRSWRSGAALAGEPVH